MKLKEFIKNLNAFVEKNPKALELDVVTSKDDEGNGFNLVYHTPCVGNYDNNDRHFEEQKEINAICVN